MPKPTVALRATTVAVASPAPAASPSKPSPLESISVNRPGSPAVVPERFLAGLIFFGKVPDSGAISGLARTNSNDSQKTAFELNLARDHTTGGGTQLPEMLEGNS